MKSILAALLTAVALTHTALAGPRDAQWQAVADAVKKGLPQTAITNLQPIIAATLKEKAYAEATKAIGQKIALEGAIEGNKAEERVVRLEAEIAKAPAEMKPVMQTLLAHWYWSYFRQNQWRFMQRTQTAEAPGKDFTTWDLPRLFAEIDKHFQAALAAEKTLKATPIAAWDGLLEKGTMPDNYRPTLYDFLAHEALSFYTSGEQAGAKAEGEFELTVDDITPTTYSPFAPLEQFVSLVFEKRQIGADEPAKLDAMRKSPIGKAYFLYRELLQFHFDDADKSALCDVDLARLVWGWNTVLGEEKNARFKTALKNFIAKNGDSPVAAMASWNLARVVKDEGDWVAAREIALQAKNGHPGTPGAKQCANLITEIESKSANITTERVWNSGSGTGVSPVRSETDPASTHGQDARATITVRYRNVDKVYFRAIAADWESFLDRKRQRPENLGTKERRAYLDKSAALEWNAALPATTDFKQRLFNVAAPTTLKPGYYFIFASHDPNFGEKENQVSVTDVWVSELALVIRPRHGLFEGFILEAGSGEPVSGAEVNAWYLDQNGNRVAVPALSTDTNGFFSLKPVEHRSYLLRVRHQGRELASANDLHNYYGRGDNDSNWPRQQTVFFTDRAIYRPGQTIQYKGICLETDQRSDSYKTLAGEQLEVVFNDPNGKEIARIKHRANDYGSFAGSFTAPRDRVMGQMNIQAQGRAHGAAHFSVEEYKRPKFEVTLAAPKVAPKLGDKAAISGKAASYTGAAVDGAKVTWRVRREVRWPWWCGWWRGGFPSSPAQEIAHGTVKTGVDGAFTVEFIAKPDLSISQTNEPTFVYSITADVTDTAGETRSDERTIRIGYAALEAKLAADDWQQAGKPVELKINTTTLDGEPQVAEGAVKVYRLKSPTKVARTRIGSEDYDEDGKPDADLSNPNNWELADVAEEHGFTTDTNGVAKLNFKKLAAGAYRVMLETQDRFGKQVTGRLPLQVIDPAAANLTIKIPQLVAAPDWQAQPGDEFMALWGTGYDAGRAFIEIEHRNKMLQRYWTTPGRTQQQIKLAVTEALRGGFTLHVTQVRENRGYLSSRHVNVPWKNKNLELKWEHLTSKLMPGQKETWTAVVSKGSSGVMENGSDGKQPNTNAPALQHSNTPERLAAELVATLYDASLDAFAPQHWPGGFGVFRHDYSTAQPQFGNMARNFQHVFGNWNRRHEGVNITYRRFPADLTQRVWGYGWAGQMRYRGARNGGGMLQEAMPMASMAMDATASSMPSRDIQMAKSAGKLALGDANLASVTAESDEGGASPGKPAGPKPDLSKVTARKNLNETAFFFPLLTSDSNGVVRMTFTMPEALTKWRFLGFAHDQQLRAGLLEGSAVTSKDIMVQPNPPRFLREGDTVEFTVKISNQSDKPQQGSVKLAFADAMTQQSADKLLKLSAINGIPSLGDKPFGQTRPYTEVVFNIPAKESRTYSWRITVPDGAPFLTYKAVASTGTLSDGEEGYLPVLSRRVFITESLPLPIRGKLGGGEVTKKFEFTKLLNSGKSKTLQHEGVTVQMVSQPAWYAVLALPYLMEFPHECSEQTFNRLYANSLARHIANSDPKIRRIFDQWKNTPALDSPLEKNQDLKSVMIEETPWYRQAKNESEARRNVGILFDDNRLNDEMQRVLQKLTEMQIEDGRWPWFPGGYGNDYITLYIVTGFGRLRHLNVDVPVDPAIRALNRLDEWMTEHYKKIMERKHPEDYVPSPTDALYLYGRSFFLKDMPVGDQHKKAVEFYLKQSRKFWLQTNNRQTQAHLAIALKRFNSFNSFTDSTPLDIMKSLKERSVTNEELGRFWRDTELSWWWYHAPIETQALMIEAFDEIMGDAQAVEDCRVWLLKQKQTQDWKTTKATADAVYGLLLRGKTMLASDKLVEVIVGGINVTPGGKAESGKQKAESRTEVEPGTGFYERRFTGAEVKAKMGEITVKKMDEGVSWGSVHWQYFEDISKVTPYAGTPLKLKKSLFTKVNTAKGPTLEAVKGPLAVGDELVVRIELRVDRDMEYVHLKDQRGSGTEPVNVLSRYKYQDGLGYYESTRDTASHFFMDYLPKGVYVFEYSTRVQLRGSYQTGVASIQCMYAPEFNSHSESLPLVVK